MSLPDTLDQQKSEIYERYKYKKYSHTYQPKKYTKISSFDENYTAEKLSREFQTAKVSFLPHG